MHTISVVEQCIKWNAKRYDRVYNNDLTTSLLLEENAELQNSETLVDILDACGDITFVVVGALWKLGFTQKEIENLILHKQLDSLELWELQGTMIAAAEDLLWSKRLRLTDNKAKMQDTLGYILGFLMGVLQQLSAIGLQHEFLNIFKAIATSNDTKEIKGKTESHIKANIVKGDKYIPPTNDLLNILKTNNKEHI